MAFLIFLEWSFFPILFAAFSLPFFQLPTFRLCVRLVFRIGRQHLLSIFVVVVLVGILLRFDQFDDFFSLDSCWCSCSSYPRTAETMAKVDSNARSKTLFNFCQTRAHKHTHTDKRQSQRNRKVHHAPHAMAAYLLKNGDTAKDWTELGLYDVRTRERQQLRRNWTRTALPRIIKLQNTFKRTEANTEREAENKVKNKKKIGVTKHNKTSRKKRTQRGCNQILVFFHVGDAIAAAVAFACFPKRFISLIRIGHMSYALRQRRRMSSNRSRFSFSNTDAGCAVIIITVDIADAAAVVVVVDCIPNGKHPTTSAASVAAVHLWADVLTPCHTFFYFLFSLHIDWHELYDKTKHRTVKSSSWENKMQTLPSPWLSVGVRHELVTVRATGEETKGKTSHFQRHFFSRESVTLVPPPPPFFLSHSIIVDTLGDGSTQLNGEFTDRFSANTEANAYKCNAEFSDNVRAAAVVSMATMEMIAIDKKEFLWHYYYHSPLWHPHSAKSTQPIDVYVDVKAGVDGSHVQVQYKNTSWNIKEIRDFFELSHLSFAHRIFSAVFQSFRHERTLAEFFSCVVMFALCHDVCMWKIDLVWTPWCALNEEEQQTLVWRMALNCCGWMMVDAEHMNVVTLSRRLSASELRWFCCWYLLSSILYRNTHKSFEWLKPGNHHAFYLLATQFCPSQTNKYRKKIDNLSRVATVCRFTFSLKRPNQLNWWFHIIVLQLALALACYYRPCFPRFIYACSNTWNSIMSAHTELIDSFICFAIFVLFLCAWHGHGWEVHCSLQAEIGNLFFFLSMVCARTPTLVLAVGTFVLCLWFYAILFIFETHPYSTFYLTLSVRFHFHCYWPQKRKNIFHFYRVAWTLIWILQRHQFTSMKIRHTRSDSHRALKRILGTIWSTIGTTL